jgi:Flp pilus assembly protein TadD
MDEPGFVQGQHAVQFIGTQYFKQATALLKRGAFAESESYLREVIRLWGNHAGALNNLGTAVWQQGRVQEAEGHYRRALLLEPEDFGVLNNLGNSLWEQSRPDQAVEFYRRALRLRPDSPETQMNLGVALSDLGHFDEAIGWFHESLRLEPNSAVGIDNLGMTLARQGKWDEALVCYDRALRLRPDFPEAHRNRAYAWLAQGDFERGWPEYEWRLRCRNYRGLVIDRPRWTGDDLTGRTILLHAEQGLGDTLQFIRFAAQVQSRGARVVVACAEPLVRLVSRCAAIDSAIDWASATPDCCDVQFPLISLPAILGTTLANLRADVPYLRASHETVEHWRSILDRGVDGAINGFREIESSSAWHGLPARVRETHGQGARATRGVFRIGIAWQGNPLNRVDRWRSFPLRMFGRLARLPGVCLISLQKGDGTEQLSEWAQQFSIVLPSDPLTGGHDRRDLLDTAAVMSQLDLVVTPESAVAHLAGSLGVRVWVALAANGDWRWMIGREDSPWYPTMRLFRQTKPGDWDGVFERMARLLSQELGG